MPNPDRYQAALGRGYFAVGLEFLWDSEVPHQGTLNGALLSPNTQFYIDRAVYL